MQISPRPQSPVPVTTDSAAEAITRIFGPRPAVSVYRPGGQRREISGAVLGNWAAKTANLLTEELETEPGERLEIRCRWGWRPLAVALGAWSAGLETRIASPEDHSATEKSPGHFAGDAADDLATHLSSSTAFDWTLAVPVEDLSTGWRDDDGAALAERFPETPDTLVDYAGLVAGFGDRFTPLAPVGGRELDVDGAAVPAGSGPVVIDVRGAEGPMTAEEIDLCAGLLVRGRAVVVLLDPELTPEEAAAAERADGVLRRD